MSTPRDLERARAGLVHRHAELRADLGGLLLEMARRDTFNLALLETKARAAVAVETEIAALDATLAAPAASVPAAVAMPSAPASCGRCHGEVPANANFCPFCGAPRGNA